MLIDFDFHRFSSDMDRIGADRFAGRTAHHSASLEGEACAVRATGHSQTLHPPVGKGKAIVGAYIIDGEKARTEAEHRQTLTPCNNCHSLTVGKVGAGTNRDAHCHTCGVRTRGALQGTHTAERRYRAQSCACLLLGWRQNFARPFDARMATRLLCAGSPIPT